MVHSLPLRALALLFAVILLTPATWAAYSYPIAPQAVLVVLALAVLFGSIWPLHAISIVVAVLPLVGFASWTGWFVVEEMDLLILAVTAGGFAAYAFVGSKRSGRVRHLSVIGWLLLAMFGAMALWSTYHGYSSAAPTPLSLFQGYNEALNSLRVGKPFGLALLALSLILLQSPKGEHRAVDLLGKGLAAALGLGAMMVVWERFAFTGLMDFSSDYRATGAFWEMHVGGAALDGFLTLTMPFVLREVMRAKGIAHWLAAALLLGLGTYASLVTFSRGVYVGVPAAMGVAWLLAARSAPTAPAGEARLRLLRWSVYCVAVALCAIVAFRAGGYRSLAALLAVLCILQWHGGPFRILTWRDWLLGVVPGACLGLLGLIVAPLVYKGVYLQFALLFAVGMAAGWWGRNTNDRWQSVGLLVLDVWLMFAAVGVAEFWGGAAAMQDALIVLAIIAGAAIWHSAAPSGLWPATLRGRGQLCGVALLLAAVVAVFMAGPYMKGRFETSHVDLDGRMQHWRDSLGLIDAPLDWLLGKGFGRYPGTYFFGVRESAYPGSYQLVPGENGNVLAVGGPRYNTGFAEMFRVSQRVSVQSGSYRVSFEARAHADVTVHVEVCEQNLLYNANCVVGQVTLKPANGAWQRHTVALVGDTPTGGNRYAPRLAFFSVGVATLGQKAEFARISLVGPDGTEMLVNGDFRDGLARWFFLSERIHLPWHIKSVYLNVLFDQGLVGLVLFALIIGGAFWRVAGGRAAAHPDAPFIAGAIAGFLVVGLFDSLLDVPRVAFLFYFLVGCALCLSTTEKFGAAQARRRHPRESPRQVESDGFGMTGSANRAADTESVSESNPPGSFFPSNALVRRTPGHVI